MNHKSLLRVHVVPEVLTRMKRLQQSPMRMSIRTRMTRSSSTVPAFVVSECTELFVNVRDMTYVMVGIVLKM